MNKELQRWVGVKPKRFDHNLIVIGGGAGGLVSAYIAAAVKAKVTLIEAHKMGGDCLNYGCVPSKALIKSAKLAHQMRHGSRYGLNDTPVTPDFKAVMQRVQQVIADIAPHDSVERYTSLGVDVLQGYATLVNPWTVQVALNDGSTQTLTTRAIADSEAHGFVKVLTVPGKDTILGATIVGTHAGDLLAEFVLAMKHGLGLNKLLGTIHIYPTLAEANKYAAGEWKRAHQPHALLRWVERYHTWRRG